MAWNTEYSGKNSTEVDRLWYETIPWESGILSIENAEAEALGLPESQRFPWDPNRKRLYIINAHHNLHCVVSTLSIIGYAAVSRCIEKSLYINQRIPRKSSPEHHL